MHNPSVRHATSLLCDCCVPGRKEVLAKAVFDAPMIEVRDRRHGTAHVMARTLDQIVRLFDPAGTTYVRRNGSAA